MFNNRNNYSVVKKQTYDQLFSLFQPVKEGKNLEKNASHVPIKEINKVISDNSSNKVAEKVIKSPQKEVVPATSSVESVTESNKDTSPDSKTELNLNGKMVIFNETRKSPVIHSTPNKEGIPLTKTMVDLQLHPNRHLDNVKTIELHTDKQKPVDTSLKKDVIDDNKSPELVNSDKDLSNENSEETIENIQEEITKSEEKRKNRKDDTSDVAAVTPNEDIKPSDDENLKIIMDLTEENNDINGKAIVGEIKVTDSTSSQEGEGNNIDDASKCTGNTMVMILPHLSPINVINQDKQDENDKMNLTVTGISSAKSSEEKLFQDSEALVKGDNIQNTLKVESKAGELPENLKVKKQLGVNIGEMINRSHAPEGFTDRHMALKSKENPNIDTSSEKEGDKKTENRNIQNEGEDSVLTMPVTEKSRDDFKIIASDETPKEMIEQKKKMVKELIESNIVCIESQIKINKDGILRDKIPEKSDKKEARESKKDDKVKVASISKEKDKASLESTSKHVVELVSKTKVIDPKNVVTKRDNTSQQKVEATVDKAVTKTTKVSETYKDATETTVVKKELPKYITTVEQNTNSSNHAQVPFGKWTEVNRQAFLNKIKETKIPTNTSNTKQLKQPNDLNRRDVLQKIDSQRQSSNATAKLQEFRAATKLNVKNEPKSFTNKPMINKETKHPVKSEAPLSSENPITKPVAKAMKQEPIQKSQTQKPNIATTVTNLPKKEGSQRKEINNQDLIDKTIEGIINRAVTTKSVPDDTKQNVPKEPTKTVKDSSSYPVDKHQLKDKSPVLFDAIEMKMNELHGIPFVERPPHELPKIYNSEQKPVAKTENARENNKPNKVPNLLPFNKVQQKIAKDVEDIDSEEEIIEHEPITGDIELNKKKGSSNSSQKLAVTTNVTQPINESPKKEPIITENDFDKFARRNSITYENCLTVNFEGNEQPNVVQTVAGKDFPVKKYSRNEILLAEAKVKSTHKQQQQQYRNSHPNKIQITSKLVPINEDTLNKNYQSKLQVAYQTALTAKRHMESPITIIEDKPVKVVFMDSHTEFTPTQLNVQGKELSPLKKSEFDAATLSTGDSMDSDVLDSVADTRTQDEAKIKIKHQRKQVLTPVETPELELIEPTDLGFQASPKKKRKTEDSKSDKSSKNLVPKKSYLLGRSTTVRETPPDLTTGPLKESVNQENSTVSHKDAASAIDNLVKAAELLETQYNNLNTSNNNVSTDTPQSTPVKRGRGRPRKYPLPDGAQEKNKDSSPQKLPLQIPEKRVSKRTSDEEDTSDDELIKENWTMGKINENIVCPICSKLFRSENVVFKHVKHCTGPSPNRSDSSKRSPRRSRLSRESESKSQGSRSDDMDLYAEEPSFKKYTPNKRKSNDVASESKPDEDELIVIEDSPKEKHNESKPHELKKTATKSKTQHGSMNLACEFCGKTFRQLSYLVSHKLQHKKEETKKTEHDTETCKSVFSCELCKKEFRKLHHLVQHRLIHNPSNISTRTSRKSSSEQSDNKTKNSDSFKQNEDQNAAFRCEPCDKSFRKLHHLVEHRETHDGINRQKITTTATPSAVEKPTPNPPPQCDFCKKTFRKLHHLIEHKEQHLDASSEKSDDKSVKSSLSTKDIIHECSLCYMVFPNEQALNKHFVNCQRKKRQSVAKQNKPAEDEDEQDNDVEESTPKVEELVPIVTENQETDKGEELQATSVTAVVPMKLEEVARVIETRRSKEIETKCETKPSPNKRDLPDVQICETAESEAEIPAKIKKVERKSKESESAKIKNTPKKKISIKDKVQPVATRRQKSTSSDLPLKRVVELAATVECSDDDEVRYMINPDYKIQETTESKLFMNVRAKKRNSLQIERPNSNDLVKRRTSLQHPPKIPRLKPKPLEIKTLQASTASRNVARNSKLETVPSTDSDDSDVKYSFPKTFVEKSLQQEPKSKEKVKTPKEKRKSLIEKRKTLSGIAKRKSLGRPVAAKHKEKPATPVKQIKRRKYTY